MSTAPPAAPSPLQADPPPQGSGGRPAPWKIWSLITLVLVVVVALVLTATGAFSSDTKSGPLRKMNISLVDMDIKPTSITVEPGTRLQLTVTNEDIVPHDLKFDGGPQTKMLNKGQKEVIEVGPIDKSVTGYCSVPGHKQAGMTLDIIVQGSDAHAGMDMGGTQSNARPAVDLNGKPGSNWKPRDATLPPAPKSKLHKLTISVEEKVDEVAPGVRQPVWTFNGTVPGPTIRGNVGDKFEITFVNNGKMGHGIDFHASWLAPDQPMRTIAPGQKLVQKWTATHAGMWLYHCSTKPMLHHMSNGMFGAVVIDPPNLPKVDKEFFVVQSEQSYGKDGADMDRLRNGDWDAVVFNGYPNQYVTAPLKAKTGERVRIWVLAAGPSGGVSFHVVGTQFDTLFKEGAYQLKPGNAEKGAAQAIDLSAAQGGFVEMVFPEAGHYAMVDHDFRRGENGSKGIIEVTD